MAKYLGAAAAFSVAEVAASLAYYRDTLGFAVEFDAKQREAVLAYAGAPTERAGPGVHQRASLR